MISLPQRYKTILLIVAGLALFAVTDLLLIRSGYVETVDWRDAFRPATMQILQGESPYSVGKVFNPPWVFLPMIPLALLPLDISSTIMFLLPIFGYAFAALKFKIDPINLLIFLANPFFYFGATCGNIDWLIPLGAVMSPMIGLFFVLAKPQIGLGITIFWGIEAYRSGGIKQVIKIFAPVTLAFGISLAVFGLWPLHATKLADVWWNLSIWPYSIPIGVGLLIHAVRNKNKLFSLTSSAFLSPYLAPQSWATSIFGIINDRAVLIGVVTSSWITWYLLVH